MNIEKIIDTVYGESGALRTILITHSKAVADKAVSIIDEKCLPVNRQFVYDAAMLHDIGIIRCDAAGIECYGTEPYIRHGLCGGEILRQYAAETGLSAESVEPFARVCERHTGAGLTAKDISEQNLPLPQQDFLPETLEEKLICYADKFFSKTRPSDEKPLDKVMLSMQKFGHDTVDRFNELHKLFG